MQEISRVYNINKWSYEQVVSRRSFYEDLLTEMTKIAVRNRGVKENVESRKQKVEKVWLDLKRFGILWDNRQLQCCKNPLGTYWITN